MWSAPYTATAGSVLTAAIWNAYVRDDLAYLKGLTDGTGTDSVVIPASLFIANDLSFRFTKNGDSPFLGVDTGDSVEYNRATNTWIFTVGYGLKFTIDGNGKLGGGSFYSSGEVAIPNLSTASFIHGFDEQPRVVWGYWGTSPGDRPNPLENTNVTTVTPRLYNHRPTYSEVNNQSGGTVYVQVHAIR
jgi:hypothetical protein